MNNPLVLLLVCADLAIGLMIEGGWSALTLRNMARAANVTPQAIAAWFPSVATMRVAIAECYASRWVTARDRLAGRRIPSWAFEERTITPPQIVDSLLPVTWQEKAFDGVWLGIVEAGRWDDGVGAAVARVHESERDVVRHHVDRLGPREQDQGEREVDLVLALVRGLRVARVSATDPMSAGRATEILESPGRSLGRSPGQRGEVTSASAGRTSAR